LSILLVFTFCQLHKSRQAKAEVLVSFAKQANIAKHPLVFKEYGRSTEKQQKLKMIF